MIPPHFPICIRYVSGQCRDFCNVVSDVKGKTWVHVEIFTMLYDVSNVRVELWSMQRFSQCCIRCKGRTSNKQSIASRPTMYPNVFDFYMGCHVLRSCLFWREGILATLGSSLAKGNQHVSSLFAHFIHSLRHCGKLKEFGTIETRGVEGMLEWSLILCNEGGT